jgi:hypothetical protein
MDDLKQYIRDNYPEIMAEFIRYTNRDKLPPVGSLVKTLRSGFGGGAGVIRKVEQLDTDYGLGKKCIRLSGDGHEYLCDVETWYKDIEIYKV